MDIGRLRLMIDYSDFQPKRTLYLAFGHDEEVGGSEGNALFVNYLKKQGVTLEYVIDEGGAVTKGVMEGVKQNIAIIGITEKGTDNYTK
jgi:carboxypeptidase PM20D1